ncbi:hypothetical protein RD792_017797 [Penstemon davidsonii]|uniref:Protein NBR1 homolog n=1 Tax=Penstemon davidsonii TaxID=160366 RepID=A0ABR0DWG5_9LAMI|nr:hypothetical protein RD792_017797 [Penstemon davidsonii]
MATPSTVVIKVKYGDTLRRFNAQYADVDLDLNIDGLRKKISSLFGFSPETELRLTYIDEDGDEVALVDDDDLRDVVKQALNPLRITVKLNAEKKSPHFDRLSGNSTPLRSPTPQVHQHANPNHSEILRTIQEPLREILKFSADLASKSLPSTPDTTDQNSLNNSISSFSEILRTVQEPIREKLVKLSTDLASNSATSAPAVGELVDYFSKVSLSYLDQLSDSQHEVRPSTQSDVPESSTVAKESEGLAQVKVDAAKSKVPENDKGTKPQLKATTEIKEVKHGKVIETSSSKAPGFNAVASDINVGKKDKTKKDKGKKISEGCSNEKSHKTTFANDDLLIGKPGESLYSFTNPPTVANSIPAGKEVNKLSEPHSTPKMVHMGVPYHVKGDSLNGRGRSLLSGAPGGPLVPSSMWAPIYGTLNFPNSPSGHSSVYECPFSGVPLGNMTAVPPPPPPPASKLFPFTRNNSQNEGSGIIFHRGVRCDGCGVHPITGLRFKSKVKVNYDLCSICFSEMGNETDYIRMDRPAVYRNHMPFKGMYETIPLPHVCSRGFKAKSGASKLDSRFIQDVNIIDGTIVAPLTPFTKIWRMRNNGTVIWPHKTQLVWIGGDRLSNVMSVEVEIPASGLPVDQELDVAVDFIAPELPGRYVSYWRMASPSGQKFGQRVWVLIQVDASIKETRREGVRGLNLNLPPVSSVLNDPEIINVEPEPMVVDSQPPEPDTTKKTVESVEPLVELQPNIEHEMKFPINDSLLVGSGASSSAPAAVPSPLYPIVDLSYVDPVVCSMAPSTIDPSSPAPVASSQSEEILLKELEEMGFKQVDLNKEILRINEYDLEKAVDDLCGVSEWDPILEELQEMGFHDTEMNKMLLKKNNGSIKRVVMDLIAGEDM